MKDVLGLLEPTLDAWEFSSRMLESSGVFLVSDTECNGLLKEVSRRGEKTLSVENLDCAEEFCRSGVLAILVERLFPKLDSRMGENTWLPIDVLSSGLRFSLKAERFVSSTHDGVVLKDEKAEVMSADLDPG